VYVKHQYSGLITCRPSVCKLVHLVWQKCILYSTILLQTLMSSAFLAIIHVCLYLLSHSDCLLKLSMPVWLHGVSKHYTWCCLSWVTSCVENSVLDFISILKEGFTIVSGFSLLSNLVRAAIPAVLDAFPGGLRSGWTWAKCSGEINILQLCTMYYSMDRNVHGESWPAVTNL